MGSKIACLGSDFYDLRNYVGIDDFVDHFLFPTRLHCEVVGAAVWHPCHHLPEGIDWIASPFESQAFLPVSRDVSLGWFGYAESFRKALHYILPRALTDAGMAPGEITLITNAGETLLPGAIHLPFAEEQFHAQSARLSHALLSHFAFDGKISNYVKSPNKFVTSLVRGLTPICSATPAYMELVERYDLGALTFHNGPELTELLRDLDRYRLTDDRCAAIAADLRQSLAPERIARQFLELIG